MARKATINMVAERAGVSRGTVDRVLNSRPHVKPDIMEKVLRAMRELNYVPPRPEQAAALGLNTALIDLPTCKLGVLLTNEGGICGASCCEVLRMQNPFYGITAWRSSCRSVRPTCRMRAWSG